MRIIAAILLITLLSGCDVQSDATGEPCKADKFFCDSADVRLAKVGRLSHKRLEEVTIINYMYFTPPFHGFAEEIGRRGVQGQAIASKLLHQKGPYVERMIIDVIRELRIKSSIDMCGLKKDLVELDRACLKLSETVL